MKFHILLERTLDERALETALARWHTALRSVPAAPATPPPVPRPGELPFPEPAPPPAADGPRRFPSGSQAIVDMSGVTFVQPHGTVGLLEFARFARSQGVLPLLRAPESKDVQSYLMRIDFFTQARELFEMGDFEPEHVPRRSASDVLLEITPIRKTEDIHAVVQKVQGRARTILAKHLHYSPADISRFIVALSEVCQNILEHSEDTGYVAIQKYAYKEKLGRNVVMIAVTDLGVGMRQSLYPRLGVKFGVSWNDVTAIQQAFDHGVSRYDDPGRGHGLRSVRELVEAWNGKISIRSGTAKVNRIPDWALTRRAIERDLPAFPGTQIFLTLPESLARTPRGEGGGAAAAPPPPE